MKPLVLNLSRVFNAPREMVFNAWVDPKQMAKWWGPHGFSAPECRMDIRPGGEIFILMCGFGTEHPMRGVVREVKAPERFVFEATALDDKGAVLLVSVTTVTFKDLGGKTQVDIKAEATPKQQIAEGMIGGMTQGWNESLDKLDTLVTDPEGRDVHITKAFHAPRDKVFKAWTDPEQLARWFAPTGCTLKIHRADVRTGGSALICTTVPDGKECWCLTTYVEVKAPERLIFNMTVADAKGHPASPMSQGMDPQWPSTTTVTVTFGELDGRTTVALHQTVRESLAKRTGAQPSWINMMDRLAAIL